VTGDRLGPLLERAQRLGFLGPGAIADHVEHARAFADLLGPPPASFLDLGAGGGLPGLVLALRWPSARGVLLEAGRRRGEHLEQARRELGLTDQVTVVIARAEEAAREPHWRGSVDLVVARGFGAPAATAECAVGFLRPGGRLAVSEPPGGDPERWDRAGLARLGLSDPEVRTGGGATAAAFVLAAPTDARWPRRTGVPAHRPLWR
jgi:16S rRNA (guanine527-N7)-methyltransferase